MNEWKLDHLPRGETFSDFKKQMAKKVPGYSAETMWRYFTFRHAVGADVRNDKETLLEDIDYFENGSFYSRSTVDTMTSKYLERLAELKAEMASTFPDDTEFDDAARIVILRARTPRQNYRSHRVGKIKNKGSMRPDK